MKYKSSNMKDKAIVYILSFLALAVFTGCSEDTNKDNNINSNTQSVPVIEVVQNENAKEIKVKEKEKEANQDESYYYKYNAKHEYDKNSEPANKDASVRTTPRTTIDANMHVRSPYENIQISLLVGKLSKNFRVKCSACHNDFANGVVGPSLLGKDSDYIFDKIQDFKSGKSTNVLMTDLINMMSTKDIRDIADEIYKFNQEIEKMRK